MVAREAPNRSRTALLNVRLLEDEKRMLEALAESDGVNTSEWVRNKIRAEHVLLVHGSQTKATRKRPVKKR